MRATDDDGTELNADFEVEPDGSGLALVLESAGGRVTGSPHPRNHQYNQALVLLLTRLRERGATITGGVVDSAPARGLPEPERTIVPTPVVLATQPDMRELRRELGRRQSKVGRNPDGNATKKIRLRLNVPGYAADDAVRLAEDLAKPANRGQAPDAATLLRDLIGDEIETVTGRPNRILEVHDDTVLVATERSPQGTPVQIAEVAAGLAKLYERGTVLVSVAELGHRSAFVGAVLRTLPGAVATENPAAVTLREVAFPVRMRFAVLDGKAEMTVRKEQSVLRRMLLRGRASAECDLCGNEFPADLLVAAHIKKRSICTDDERNDLQNVAMLACRFGCDSLFEAGYVSVDESGRIRAAALEDGLQTLLGRHLDRLDGRTCGAHRLQSAGYFAWHRGNIRKDA